MIKQHNLSILIFVVILSFFISNCKRIFDSDFYQVNCENLQHGIIKMDSEMVCEEITNFLLDLKPDLNSNDKFGHKENLNTLVNRINNNCDNVSAEVLCYACIETLPPQSEIKLSTDSSGVEVARILDILTPGDDVLSCIRLHQGHF